MSNTLTFHISAADFKQQCHSFFDAKLGTDASKTAALVTAFSSSEFETWSDALFNDYSDTLHTTIQEVAKMVRGDYDALTRDDYENDFQ